LIATAMVKRRTEGCTPGPILDTGDGNDRARIIIVSMAVAARQSSTPIARGTRPQLV
jgi:hypothetical protein